jgi:hypothetical protein
MIWITEFDGDDIIFQFYRRELPEAVPMPKKTKVNHLEYNGGFQTNQIFGVFDQPVEWTGMFYGTYVEDGETITAKQRLDKLMACMGKPVRVGFPVETGDPAPGLDLNPSKKSSDYHSGDKGTYIIEEVNPRIYSHLKVEYTIRLVPHQRQEKIKPGETTTIKIETNFNNAKDNTKKIAAKAKGKLAKAKQIASKNAVVQDKTLKDNSLTGHYQHFKEQVKKYLKE